MKSLERVRLSDYTTIGLGGEARYFAPCATVEDIRETLAWARQEKLRVHVLGGGSNTVFADAGFAGLVLYVALRGATFNEEAAGLRVTAAGGEPWDALVAETVARGYYGLACLSGIPGTVGAAPVQNIGAYGQEVAETLVELKALDRVNGAEVVFKAAECGFGYRQSRFKGAERERYVITEVTFFLPRTETPPLRYAEVARAIAEAGVQPSPAVLRETVLALRRAKAMVVEATNPHTRSCGSFFTNPIVPPSQCEALRQGCPALPAYPMAGGCKLPAAWLIEQAGFPRGTRRGGVGLSPYHALALVNYGGTTAELLAFAAEIQAAVAARFDVRLEPEPVVVA